MPSNKQKKVTRLGEGFGGMISNAITSLTSSGPRSKKRKNGNKSKTTRNTARAKKAAIDDIFN